MKQKFLSYITLLAALLVGGVNSAWAETTIGATGKGWAEAGSSASYTIAANKTLTLTFTLTDYSGDWAGYVLNLTKTNAIAFGGDNGYVWFRSPDFAWYKTNWNAGAVVSNTNTKGNMSQSDWQAFLKDATTVMAIQRFGTQVFIKTTVTKNETSYSHYFVQEIGTMNDIYALLCADAAVITISSAVTTETGAVEPATATIGAVGNDGGFGASPVTSLEPESVLSMHFKNSSAKGETYQNYGIELAYNGNYANIVLGGGRWGTLLVDAEGDPVTTPVTNKEEHFSEFGSNFKDKMDGADVTLTIARSGRVVTITAVHTPSDNGTPYVLKYTIEPNATAFPNFATEDIAVNLSTDGSHITYNFPITEVNAEVSKYGWATFSSDYKLDFTGITDLEAYAVTGHEDNAITISDALGVVAAGQGVLLKGLEGDNPTFYNIPISAETAYSGANLLVAGTGAEVAAEANKTKYALSVEGGKAVFKKIDGYSPTIAKGKAYLVFDEVVAAPKLTFDFNNPTGISEKVMVNSEKIANTPVYNLAGQRVAQPKKGLYIVNGKKIVK